MIEYVSKQKEECPQCNRLVKVGLFILRATESHQFKICHDCLQALTDCVTKSKRSPIVFNKATQAWEHLDVVELQEWDESYEKTNVREELLKMADWIVKCQDTKRTNKRDWRRFIMNWLRRADNAKVKFNS